MISIFPYSELGNHNYGWLDAHYHFNFAEYYHPDKSGYPPLIVWNDDCIQPGTGFPMHSHRDMEIITYIRQGAITHEDSLGNKGVTKAGEIQIMSAGTGITHSEYNHEDNETLLFQIWIQPNRYHIKPRWENVDIQSEKKIHKIDGVTNAGIVSGTSPSGKNFSFPVPALAPASALIWMSSLRPHKRWMLNEDERFEDMGNLPLQNQNPNTGITYHFMHKTIRNEALNRLFVSA